MDRENNIKKRSLKHCLIWLLAAVMLVLSGLASAECDYSPDRTVALPLPTGITANGNAAIGTPLSPWIASPAVTDYFLCSERANNGMGGDSRSLVDSRVTVFSPDLGHQIKVWNTNVAGVGVAMVHRWYAGHCGWSVWSEANHTPYLGAVCPNSARAWVGAQVKIALVKTGRIVAGSINTMTLMRAAAIGSQTPFSGLFSPVTTSRISYVIRTVTIVPTTCEVSTSSTAVRLSPTNGLSASSFSGSSSTSNPVPFELRLKCSSNLARLGVTFTDISNPGNGGNILPLSRGSSATGLGVQILYKDSPVGFGPDSSAQGTQGQVMVDVPAGQTQAINLPFKARYIQTGQTVTPGRADATASFTLSYQ